MESKKKLKFNIVDVIFLLAVLAGVLFVALRISGSSVVARLTGGEAPEAYIITFTGDEVADYVTDRITFGAPLTDDAGTLNLGTLIDLQLSESISYNINDNGQYVTSSKPGYHSLLLMGEVQAVDNGNGLTVDGTKLGVGHSMVVRAGDAKLYLIIYDIQKKTDSEYAGQ